MSPAFEISVWYNRELYVVYLSERYYYDVEGWGKEVAVEFSFS